MNARVPITEVAQAEYQRRQKAIDAADDEMVLRSIARLELSEAAPREEHESWIYGTHLVPLMACVVETSGPVLELGCGRWSTPVLRAYCLAAKREFVSVDSNRKWADRIGKPLGMTIGFPRLEELARREWSVVLVDHDPWFVRVYDANRFSKSEFVLVHDSQFEDIAPQLAQSLPNWQHHYEYTGASPNTMILSNTRRIPVI
jgi:hypothetical protein